MHLKLWIKAFRLRTLPLALSCVGMGAFLARMAGSFRWDIFLLCVLTTVCLQILSNLANDYGDSVHGADHAARTGPVRMVQAGLVAPKDMFWMMIAFAFLSLFSGLLLLWVSFGDDLLHWLVFLSLGLLSIAAAITYTVGRKPYGYAGLGDVAVLLFFGLLGVAGTAYLFTRSIQPLTLLPALSCGLLATGVLNINNIRDRESDRRAGKKSIPVRWGHRVSVWYHFILLGGSLLASALYVILSYRSPVQWLFLVVIPLLWRNARAVYTLPAHALDPWLRQLALSTLLFVILFGAGHLIAFI